MASQGAAFQRELLRAQGRQALVHGHDTGQQAPERHALAAHQFQRVKQHHHAAALGPHGFACDHMGGQAVAQAGVVGNVGRAAPG